MKHVLFRADSSSTIGHGHIMRDLTLAKQIQREIPKANIYFATKNLAGNINHKITQEGFVTIEIQSDSKEELSAIIEQKKIDFIILDHYDISLEIEKFLSQKCEVLAFDDTFTCHATKWVLNHSFIASVEDYNYLPKCNILAGANYTLLGEAFLQKSQRYTPLQKFENLRVLITLGGSDPLQLSFLIKKYLLQNYKNFQVTIVTTEANKKLSYLKLVDKALIINENNMAELMQKQDLIITSASSSLLETFTLKKAFIAIKCAQNQRNTLEVLKRENLSNLIEKFSLAALKKALKCVQYQEKKIQKVLQKYKFKKNGIIEEIIGEKHSLPIKHHHKTL